MRYYYIIREYSEDCLPTDYYFKSWDKAKEKFIEILKNHYENDPDLKEDIIEDYGSMERFYRECWREEEVDEIVSLFRFTFDDEEEEE